VRQQAVTVTSEAGGHSVDGLSAADLKPGGFDARVQVNLVLLLSRMRGCEKSLLGVIRGQRFHIPEEEAECRPEAAILAFPRGN
jgi:hypothetical protein